jgi:two-component system cell cycle response regulator
MTRASTPQNRPRGVPLLVGRSSRLREVSAQLGPLPEQCPSLFDAITTITLSRRGPRINKVVIDQDTVQQVRHAGIDALRLADPSLDLILLQTPSDAPQEMWMAAKFDGCIAMELDAGEAADAVLDKPLPLTPVSDAPVQSSPQPSHDSPSASPETPDTVTAAPVSDPDESIAASPHAEPPHAARIAPPRTLGDTDLVEAILDQRDDLETVALSIIRQQAGIDPLHLLDDLDAVPPDCTGQPVAHGNSFFGYLAAHARHADALAQWSPWLARWLALNDSHRQYRTWALVDDLTGAGNRRFFRAFMKQALQRAKDARRPITLMIFDIDDFKQYNDSYGHEAGDEILCETVRLMNSVVRGGDRVCRVGGDEFAVIFADTEGPRVPASSHPHEIGLIAQRFQQQIAKMRFPKLGHEAPGRLTISGGLATYPWDGTTVDELLHLADQRALQSKRKGKNVISFGPDV